MIITDDEMKVAIADNVGMEECLAQLAEECSELSQAALKYRRSLKDLTPVTKGQALKDLLEEMADVEVCKEQVIFMIGHDVCAEQIETQKQNKLLRWFRRITPPKA